MKMMESWKKRNAIWHVKGKKTDLNVKITGI